MTESSDARWYMTKGKVCRSRYGMGKVEHDEVKSEETYGGWWREGWKLSNGVECRIPQIAPQW